MAQDRTVSGKVTSAEDQSPLPGVNVVVKSTGQGTTTDIDGNYKLNVPSQGGILKFSFIGMSTIEETIGSRTVIDVALESDISQLSEVVVVGYGSMDRVNVTGAISSIQGDEIVKAPVPNLVEAMRGQVPGMRMSRTSGQPGSGVDFVIRGKNSLTSGEEPLIVIDGVPTTGGNLSEINPDDVESINVMKDAAAASIYGARGANGVILITTKQGQSGKMNVNVKFSQGFTDLAMRPRFFNGEEYVQLRRDAAIGAGQNSSDEAILADAVERENYEAGNEIDWHDLLIRRGMVTNAGVSLSGGSDKVTYYMNSDLYREKGVAEHTDFNRYSFRLNTEFKPNDIVKLGSRIQLSLTDADETGSLGNPQAGGAALFVNFIGNTPLGRTHNQFGEIVPTVRGDQFQYNPLFKYRESEAVRRTSRILVNPYLEVKIIDGLKYTLNASLEHRTTRYNQFTSSIYNVSNLEDDPGRNNMQMLYQEPKTYLVDHILSYNKTFAQKHKINATFVYGFQTFRQDEMQMINEGTETDLLSYNDIGFETPFMRTAFGTDDWSYLYYVGRLGYSYNDKYTVTGTLRYDGSTKFGPENRWGLFPSVAFAWNADKERFLEDLEWLSSLKFRVSQGIMGNDQIQANVFLPLTQNVTYPFNNTVYGGRMPGQLHNPGIKWEESRQFNAGLNFGMFSNRLYGSLDVYRTNTVDLILTQQISGVSGDPRNPPSIITNIGETRNQGVEISLNYFPVSRKSFQWEVSANIGRDRNEIVRLTGELDEDGNQLDNIANNWFIGQDIDVVFGLDFLGIYQQGEGAVASAMHPTIFGYGVGDPKIRDVNGDGVITIAGDRTFLGTETPSWYGGLRNTLTYKGFELTVLIETVQGVTRVNNFYGSLNGRSNEPWVNYWTPTNRSNEFPQPNAQREYYFADAVRVRDASFISLRNVSFAYAVPHNILQNSIFKDLRTVQFYVRGNNLLYITDFVGYSPETNFGAFPITKMWMFGTNISF